ncbi:MAG TPA: TlpA disulfide reductase family protein [Pyrinomonadaceae bacterium]|jgi:peroxiredoxin|nr:TlpA disulfide reductase family protein [Pyrinomonadaceae bacterium]
MKLLSISLTLAFFALSASAQVMQPAFAALDIAGSRVDTAALRGKIVVINLWFVNCPNCVEEIGQLNQLVDEYKGNNDVVFLGLAASPKPLIEKFLAKNPFKYQIIPNAQMIILSKFGTPDKKGEINVAFPMHFVLDRDGKIIIKGQGSKTIEPMRAELKKQLASKTVAD